MYVCGQSILKAEELFAKEFCDFLENDNWPCEIHQDPELGSFGQFSTL